MKNGFQAENTGRLLQEEEEAQLIRLSELRHVQTNTGVRISFLNIFSTFSRDVQASSPSALTAGTSDRCLKNFLWLEIKVFIHQSDLIQPNVQEPRLQPARGCCSWMNSMLVQRSSGGPTWCSINNHTSSAGEYYNMIIFRVNTVMLNPSCGQNPLDVFLQVRLLSGSVKFKT